MGKNRVHFSVLLLLILISGCFQDEVLLKKELYGLENIIIEEKVDLQEEQYTLSLNFIAQHSDSHYRIKIAYPNLQAAKGENSAFALPPVLKALEGFSAELYENNNPLPAYSFMITEKSEPKADQKTCTLFLGDEISLLKSNSYELRLTLPAKKDTEEKYSLSVLVVGTTPVD